MKYLIILLASLALVCTPLGNQRLHAQPDVGDTAGDVLEVATESAQTIGAAATVAVIVSVIVLVIVVGGAIGLVVFIWKGGLKPLFGLIDKANQKADAADKRADDEREAREASEKRLTEYRERQAAAELVKADALERQVAASEKLAERMSKIETSEQAKQGRDDAVQQVNKHTDDTVEPIVKAVDNILKLLTDDKAVRDKRDGDFDKKLDEAIRELRQLKNAVMKGDTGELNPDAVPTEDPSSKSPAPPTPES